MGLVVGVGHQNLPSKLATRGGNHAKLDVEGDRWR